MRIERRPRIYVLSTIASEENRMATNKETIQSAILSQCGKTLLHERMKRTIVGFFSVGIQKRSQSERRSLWGFASPWTHHCEEESRIAAWKLHKNIYNIRGTHQENKETFLKSQTVTGLFLGLASVRQEDKLCLTQVHPRTWWARTTLFMKKKKSFRNRKNLVQLLRQMGHLQRQKKLRFTLEILTCLSPSNYWKIHQPYSRLVNYVKPMGIPMNGRKTNTHIDLQWQNHQLHVEKVGSKSARFSRSAKRRSGSWILTVVISMWRAQ